MAQQIKIDIIADAKKLSEGLNEVNKQTGIFTDKAKTAFAAASAAASAYAAKLIGEGVKSAIADEQAQVRLEAALKNTTKATDDQVKSVEDWITKQGELYGVTDDQLRPAIERLVGSTKDIKEAQKLANLAMDIAAQKNIDVETAANALAKANDGNVNALKKLGITLGDNAKNVADYNKEQKKLNKLLDDQAFALKNYGPKSKEYIRATEKVNEQQKLLSTYTKESVDWVGELSKQFSGAAANAADTNAGKMKILATRMEELKEGIGVALLPVVDKLTTFLLKLLDAFSSLPGPVQTILTAFLGIVAVGGPLLGFLANAKTAMVTLGLVSEASAIGINFVRIALAGLGIGLVIAAIVLLIQHWDDLKVVAEKVGNAVKEFIGDMVDKVKEFLGNAVDWIKDNWPKILALLTGPFGLFIAFVIKYKDEIFEKISGAFNAVKDWLSDNWSKVLAVLTGPLGLFVAFVIKYKDEILEKVTNAFNTVKNWLEENWPKVLAVLTGPFGLFALWIVTHKDDLITKFNDLWDNVKTAIGDKVSAIGTAVKDSFYNLFFKTIPGMFDKFTNLVNDVWDGIKFIVGQIVKKIFTEFGEVFGKMTSVGESIANGIMKGLTSVKGLFRNFIKGWVEENIPEWIKAVLRIQSPSKVMMGIGENITKGLYMGMGLPGAPGINLPQINVGGGAGSGINITINAGAGTDPYVLGRTVKNALNKYGAVSA